MKLAEMNEKCRLRHNEYIASLTVMENSYKTFYNGLQELNNDKLIAEGIDREEFTTKKLFPSLYKNPPDTETYTNIEVPAAIQKMEKVRAYKLKLMSKVEELLK